jgi:Tetratricopeptide repeat
MTGQGDTGTSNEITGGTFNGPVLQGCSFQDLTSSCSRHPPGMALTNLGVALQEVRRFEEAIAAHQAALAIYRETGFTGREAELAQVAGLLDPAAAADAVVVSAVAGLAGVGKTALAVHAAHAARLSGWFAGGVLFIDLHGYDEKPVQPAQALDALLRALGVPDEHIPEGAEQRAGLYRSVLAQIGEPVLVVTDNASSEAQVRPLLPGPGGTGSSSPLGTHWPGSGRGCSMSPFWARWPR